MKTTQWIYRHFKSSVRQKRHKSQIMETLTRSCTHASASQCGISFLKSDRIYQIYLHSRCIGSWLKLQVTSSKGVSRKKFPVKNCPIKKIPVFYYTRGHGQLCLSWHESDDNHAIPILIEICWKCSKELSSWISRISFHWIIWKIPFFRTKIFAEKSSLDT